MNKGWISLYRKTLDNPKLDSDNDYWTFWTKLLLLCNHGKMDKIFEGKRITLRPGQIITGRKYLAEKCNISEAKAERIIKWLISEQQIEQQTSTKNRLITIKNWGRYQKVDNKVNNKRTTSEQQTDTYNNNNNGNNDNNKNYSASFLSFYQAYPVKKGKKAAYRAWKNAKDKPALSVLLKAIEQQKKSDSWRGGYIPYPATWLNQGRWDDEITIKQVSKKY